MKRLFNILPYVFLLLVWVLACTKDVDLITEVEFELSETHDQEGYVNQPLATTVTVVPEEALENYSYSFTYSTLEGVGYFENLEGKTYSLTEKIPFNPLSSSVMYKGTEKGTHTIKIEAQDNYGQKRETQIKYTIIDVPVEWTATSPISEIELGKQASVFVTLGTRAEMAGMSYERNYAIIANQGVLASADGSPIEIDTYAAITAGSYQMAFTPEALGPATLQFRLRDSNKQELSATLNFEVVADIVDTKAPELQVLGNDPLELFLGTSYTEPGATAVDDIDGDISERIAIDTTALDMNKEGTYEVRYSVSDDDGNTADATRTVNVVRDPNGNSPPIANNDTITAETNKSARLLVLQNDTDSDTPQSELTITAVSPYTPDNAGTLEFDTREIRFEPAVDFDGEVTFEYTITDGNPGNNATATVTLIIKDGTIAPTGIEVSPETLGLVVGNTQQLSGRILPADATDQNMQWSSSDTNIATVDNNGNVTAIASGTATITVTSSENSSLTDTTTVTVTAPDSVILVGGITVTRNRSSIQNNETEQFKAVVNPTDATNTNVTWSSDNTAVATVDAETGLVTAVADGVAIITAAALDDSGISDSASITVTEPSSEIPVNSITVTRNRSNINEGETEQFNAVIAPSDASDQAVTWSSDDTSVATVDSGTGMVTAVAEGSATITATATDGSGTIGTASITVVAPFLDVLVNRISVANASVPYSGNVNFLATVLPEDATNKVVVWSSDNPGIASVDSNTGVVTGMDQGTATITATATDGSGVTGSGVITVTEGLSGENDITAYSYPHISGTSQIDANNHTVAVKVFTGTDRNVAPRTIEVSEFATIDPRAIGRNFYSPVTYTVTAQNGDEQIWTVTITEDTNNTKEITKFTINGIDADIRGTDITINLSGTDLSTLTPIIEHTGVSVFPESGTQQDLRNQKQFTVKSIDGSEVIYTVKVTN